MIRNSIKTSCRAIPSGCLRSSISECAWRGLDVSQAEIETLAESLRNDGQKVPILVRPHPEKPGEYEIVAGRRRLAACRLAGLQVRAEVQDLDDAGLIMGQAIENIARENLTYIERVKLAIRMVDEAGLDPADIDTAYSCGKTDRSRYLKIGRGVPDDILSFVGKAPGNHHGPNGA